MGSDRGNSEHQAEGTFFYIKIHVKVNYRFVAPWRKLQDRRLSQGSDTDLVVATSLRQEGSQAFTATDLHLTFRGTRRMKCWRWTLDISAVASRRVRTGTEVKSLETVINQVVI